MGFLRWRLAASGLRPEAASSWSGSCLGGAQARFRPPALRALRSQVTVGGRIMKARLRRSARTFLEKPPTGKALSSLGCAHFAPREVPDPKVFSLVTTPTRVSPPKPAGSLSPQASGSELIGVAVAPTRGPLGMKERPPGPGRRNRGRRLASSTPADGKGGRGPLGQAQAPAP